MTPRPASVLAGPNSHIHPRSIGLRGWLLEKDREMGQLLRQLCHLRDIDYLCAASLTADVANLKLKA